MDEPTKLKVLLALEPRVVMAAMHTTMIRANITAYSTAVGPSSALMNETRLGQTAHGTLLKTWCSVRINREPGVRVCRSGRCEASQSEHTK